MGTVKGIVLAGGGVKGAFEVGVAMKLLTEEADPRGYQVLAGTSTGSILATILAQEKDRRGQYLAAADVAELYKGIKSNDDMYKSGGLLTQVGRVLLNGSLYDPSPLKAKLQEHLHGVDQANALRIETVNLRTGEPYVLTESEVTPGNIVSSVMASCAMPGLFPPVALRRTVPLSSQPAVTVARADLYVDGGVANAAPLRESVAALKGRAAPGDTLQLDIVLANPRNEAALAQAPTRIDKILIRTLNMVLHQAFVDDVSNCLYRNAHPQPGDRQVELTIYGPTVVYSEALDFNPKTIGLMLADGYTAKPIPLETFE